MHTDELSFGQWVRQRRLALHLTQQQLGALAGCAAETIRKIESDLRSPSPRIAVLIAQALQLPPNVHSTFIRWARGDLAYVPALLDDTVYRDTLSYDYTPVQTTVGNLPFNTSSLVGRDKDLIALQDMLVHGRIRLITLTGTGGVGKTRLALALAESLYASFPDGCFFVALASLTDPDLVLSAIAQTIEVSEIPGHPLLATLQAFLRNKAMLMVLDNFEHVLPAGIAVGRLLQAAPHLTALVTSRAALRLQGEHEYEVRPLAVPPNLEENPSVLLQYDAVRLFIDRAQTVKANFHLEQSNAAAIVEMCARLDGLPLAIELAAARVKILEPRALLQRLGRCLPLLTGGAYDLPVRHQTLRSAIDWSYNLLEPEEQTVFARLAVFSGGWSLDAAQVICNAAANLTLPVLDLVQSLVNKSVVQHVDQGQDEPRFDFLQTIHEYALERLIERDDANDVKLQHALYHLGLAENALVHLASEGQQAWLERLEVEHKNCQAAFSWLLELGARDTALSLCSALARFWWICGYLHEGHAWLKQDRNVDDAGAETLRARTLYWIAILALHRSNHAAVEHDHIVNLSISRHAQERFTKELLDARGLLANVQGDPRGARIEYEQTHMLLKESLLLADNLENTPSPTFALNNVGLVAFGMKEVERTQSMLIESLVQFWKRADQRNCVEVLEGLAIFAIAEGKSVRAANLLTAASALRLTIGAVRNAYQQHQYDTALSAIESQLAQPTRVLVPTHGTGMTLEQAVKYALAEDTADGPG